MLQVIQPDRILYVQVRRRVTRLTTFRKREEGKRVTYFHRFLLGFPLQASNCVEEKEWADLLTRMCLSNDKRLAQYHPAAYIKGAWQCCKSPEENCLGCARVTKTTEGIHTSNVDIDRELSRLHTLSFSHIDRIENVLSKCFVCLGALTKGKLEK